MLKHTFAVLTAWSLVVFAASAQPSTDQLNRAREEAAQAQREVQRLEQQADSQVYSYRKAQAEIKTAADRFNGQVRVVRNEGQYLELRTQIANQIISLRKKDDFDKWLNTTREKWGVTQEFGYRRIREVNGLDGSTYQRFYDNTGKLQVTAFREYYQNLQRSREEWEKERKRAVDAADKIERDYNDLVKRFGSVKASQDALAGARREAQRRVERVELLDRERMQQEERRRQQEEAERLRNRRRGPYID